MYFKQSTHQYIIGEKPYTSFSSIIKLVEPEKDWNEIASKYAKKNKMTVEQVKALWEEKGRVAREKGTLFHSLKEEEDKLDSSKPVFFSEYEDDIKPIRNLETLEDGIYPELCLYNNEFQACGMADKVIIETIKGIRYVDIDDYKGLDINTPIPTDNGFKLMKDIQIGDLVFDGDGNLTKVTNISTIHYKPCYKIKFSSNEEIICDYEHKWELSYRKGTNNYQEKQYTTQEIFENFDKLVLKKIPRIKSTNLKLKDSILPLDPYILGLWLGDGDKSEGRITNMNENVWLEIERRGFKISENHDRFSKTSGKASTRTIYGIRKHLREMNLLHNKHIPFLYLRASHQQRLDLLRGFMDADGYYNPTRNRCVMITTKEWQAKSISELINSLGWIATIIPAFTSGFGKYNIPCFHICFTPKENPFLSRNQDIDNFHNNINGLSSYRRIISIEKTLTIPTKCITVESKLETYLFGHSYIKTHNSSETIDTESYFDVRNQKYAMLAAPLNSLMDCNFMKYSLQLSMYAFFLEKYNFTPRKLTIKHLIIKDRNLEPPKSEPKYNIDYENKKYYVQHEIDYDVKYLKKEVKTLLQFHKSKLQK